MSRSRRAGLAAVGLGAAAIGLVSIVPGVVERRLGGWIESAASSVVEADVRVGSVDVSLFGAFPLVEVEVTDLRVEGRGPFAGVELARVPALTLGVDLRSALSGTTVVIEQVHSTGAAVRLVVDEQGRENWQVVTEGDTLGEAWRLHLDQVEIRDLDVTWDDRTVDLVTEIEDIDMRARADLTQSLASVDSSGTLGSLTMRYGGVTWLQATRWRSELNVQYDQETGQITFGENTLRVNELPLQFSGTAIPHGDAWRLDLDVEATDTSFKSLLSLVPSAYGDPFADVTTSGNVSLSGSIDGLYDPASDDLPGFDVDLAVTDGQFRYPDLPGVDNVTARVGLEHPGGPRDRVTIDVPRIALQVAGTSLTGRVRLENPVSDPLIDVLVDGDLDIGALRRTLPRQAGAPEVDGLLDLDFAIRGRMSDFELRRLERVKADGTVRARDLVWTWDELPVEVERLDLVLSPSRVVIKEARGRGMGSDVGLSGEVQNLAPWLLSDAPLRGALVARSEKVDLRPFQGDGGVESDASVLVVCPNDLDVSVDASIGRLITEDFTLRSASGRVGVADGVLSLNRMKGKMFGGEVVLSGTYSASSTDRADVDLQIETRRTRVGDAVATFETLVLVAPVLQRAVGSFDSAIRVKTQLGSDGSPDLSLIASAGNLSPVSMSLQSAVLTTVGTQLNNQQLAALDLAGARIAYAFEAGRVDLKPFTARLGRAKATLRGGFGPLDKSLDLAIDLPVKTTLIRGAGLLDTLGESLPARVDVKAHIGGTYDRPKVKLGVGEAVLDEVLDAALDPLVAAATQKGDRLLAEARAAADTLLSEAEQLADTLLADARKAARKLKREARGDPLKQLAAEAAARLLEQEGEKAAAKALAEANKAADKLVEKARKERDTLIAKATSEVRSRVR